MRTHDRSLFRSALAHTSLLGATTGAVFLAPLPLYGLDVPCTALVGGMAIALLYPIFTCFCSHTIYHRVLLRDAGLKERFDRAARDSVCLFDDRRRSAGRELRHISVDTVRATKEVKDLRSRLMAFGWMAMLYATTALAAQSYFTADLPTLAAVMASLILYEVGALLLRCRGRIGRDFPLPGPAAADYDRLDKEVEAFERLQRELLLGRVDREMCCPARRSAC